MAQRAQARDQIGGDMRLDVHDLPVIEPPARCIAGRLRVLVIVQHAHQRLHMALWLHAAAHHPKAHDRGAILGQEGGNDRVERPLARCHTIGVVRIKREARPAVLQRQPPFGQHNARPEAHEV